jgi:ATP-dependent RNA helicase DeaD
MTDFSGVAPAIAKALVKRGYTDLTPVQKSMLDPALAASDALVSAQTGSGKTVAFGLALAPTLLDGEERFEPAAEPNGARLSAAPISSSARPAASATTSAARRSTCRA